MVCHMWTFHDLYVSVTRCCKVIVLSLWRNYAWIMCHQTILHNVATTSNTLARWRAMHASRLQNVRCIHRTQNCWFYERCLVQLIKLRLWVSFKRGHKFDKIMYNKLRPSFKHFSYTRQMASHVVHPLLLVLVDVFWQQYCNKIADHWCGISNILSWNWNYALVSDIATR